MACYHPITIPVKGTDAGGKVCWNDTTVSCGHCIGCRADQARDWTIRIMHECQMHDHAWFITLTYDNHKIPEHGTLNPADLSLFFRTLRKDHERGTISYYACGEYGDTTERPHYHAVLFGAPFLDRTIWNDYPGNPVWTSEALEHYWPHGLSQFGAVTPGSAAYVAGYVRKKLSKRHHPDAYLRVDGDTGELVEVQQEFSRMSLNPAVGRRWIEKYWKDVYPADRVILNGREYKPPRYYDKWMAEHHPHVLLDVKVKRDREAKHLEEETLQAKEKIHKARTQLFETRRKI